MPYSTTYKWKPGEWLHLETVLPNLVARVREHGFLSDKYMDEVGLPRVLDNVFKEDFVGWRWRSCILNHEGVKAVFEARSAAKEVATLEKDAAAAAKEVLNKNRLLAVTVLGEVLLLVDKLKGFRDAAEASLLACKESVKEAATKKSGGLPVCKQQRDLAKVAYEDARVFWRGGFDMIAAARVDADRGNTDVLNVTRTSLAAVSPTASDAAVRAASASVAAKAASLEPSSAASEPAGGKGNTTAGHVADLEKEMAALKKKLDKAKAAEAIAVEEEMEEMEEVEVNMSSPTKPKGPSPRKPAPKKKLTDKADAAAADGGAMFGAPFKKRVR